MLSRGREGLLAVAIAMLVALTRPCVSAAQSAAPNASPAPSAAPDETPVMRAAREFERGVQLLDDARYGEAAEALERSLALRESAAALYNLALAYRGSGRYLRAIEAFERFVTRALPGDAAVTDARTMAEELRHSLAHPRLVVHGGAADVFVDGARVAGGNGDVVLGLSLDPGRHVFEVRRPGYRPVREEHGFAPGENAEIAIDAAAHPMPAQLHVDADVASAEIAIDGAVASRGSYDAAIAPGRHVVEVRASGHQSQTRVCMLTPGDTERWVVMLPRAPNSLLHNRWLLGGAGAAVVAIVAGVTIGAVVASSGTMWDGGTTHSVLQGVSAR